MKRLIVRLHGLKVWIEALALTPRALWALFLIAFIESSVLPMPPDVLLIALGVGSPKKSLRFALICTAGSILGSYLGYFIGCALFDSLGKPILQFYGIMDHFGTILRTYRENGILTLFIAGFTPIPYMIFTIAAGFHQTLDLTTLTVGSLIGRSSRFFLVGGLLYVFGAPVKVFIDRYFDKLSVAFVTLFILTIIAVQWVL